MPSALEKTATARTHEDAEPWEELEWRLLDRVPGQWDDEWRLRGNPFHCSAYLAAHAALGDRAVGIFEARSGRPVIGGLLCGASGMFRAYSFAPGIDSSSAGVRLVEWLRTEGCTRFRLGSFYRGFEGQAVPKEVTPEQRVEFVHDLSRPEDDWWAALHSQHRRKLRRAAKEGFILKKIPAGHAGTMAKLSRSWSRRRGLRRNWLDLLRTWWNYRQLLVPLSDDGIGVLYGLYRRDGGLLTAVYMLETHASAYYMMGASSEAGYRAGASFDLFWKLGRRYREGGLSALNFGGVPEAASQKDHPENGVYRFKSGFGALPAPRVSWVSKEG